MFLQKNNLSIKNNGFSSQADKRTTIKKRQQMHRQKRIRSKIIRRSKKDRELEADKADSVLKRVGTSRGAAQAFDGATSVREQQGRSTADVFIKTIKK
jgi:hypothetical protein